MSNKLIVIMIHGMGNQDKNYHEKFEKNLRKQLTPDEEEGIVVAPIFYQDLVSDPDGSMWRRMTAESLNQKGARKLLLDNLSDASTYQFRSDDPESSYRKVHNEINITLRSAVARLFVPGEDEPEYKIIAFAHSLGGQILSNHIWDAQRGLGIWGGARPGEHEDFSKLGKFITYGCNIPLFVSGRNDAKPIDKPSEDFEWRNYYDKDDLLGWPLEPISNGYKDIVVDEEMNVGGFWRGRTPLTHLKYDGDEKFLELSVQHIRDLLD